MMDREVCVVFTGDHEFKSFNIAVVPPEYKDLNFKKYMDKTFPGYLDYQVCLYESDALNSIKKRYIYKEWKDSQNEKNT
jgi:hypothetical protein